MSGRKGEVLMTFFSIMLGGESPESTGKSSLCGNYFFPPLYYIDIHLLQTLILIRRILHITEHEGLTKRYLIKNIKKSLDLKNVGELRQALTELSTSQHIKWCNQNKLLVH